MTELTAQTWEQRYQDQQTGWDLGQPAPPFVELLKQQNSPKPGSIAVLGSGYGHDAILFAQNGFEVIGFDYAPTAIAKATELGKGWPVQFKLRNIFELIPEFSGTFDYVLEHTCFCAIDPKLRKQYVEIVANILQPEGELIALFWAHQRQGGPPYGSNVKELQQLFEKQFDIISFEKSNNSVSSRQNEEYLVRMIKKR
jgi:SAM-dependent methyltransferase